MSYQLESFINFCDNMQIVEEGFKDTKIYAVIKNILDGLKKAILIMKNRVLKIAQKSLYQILLKLQALKRHNKTQYQLLF